MKDLDIIQTFYQETGQVKSNHELEYRLKKSNCTEQAETETRLYLLIDLKSCK